MQSGRNAYTADLVIPCYQEEDALPGSIRELHRIMGACLARPDLMLASYRLILVDDGSRDATWSIIEDLARTDPLVTGVKLSRNFGHQSALLAGLEAATADVVISLDADLQDDVEVVQDMLAAYRNGYDLALGIRNDRSSDRRFKRHTANFYYRFLGYMGVTIIPNHADFRLMSRAALDALLTHREVNLYLRGLVPSLGFAVALVPYTRKARQAGSTKYTLAKMTRLAVDGITSFSTMPLRLVAVFGIVIFLATVVVGLYVLVVRLLFPSEAVPGWASTLLPLVSLGGMQILSVGILGEYIGKIYMEVKQRPRYLVEKKTERSTELSGK